MSASFASALSAAHDAAGTQSHPPGALYMVATPIGNLADITLRALHLLQKVDAVACEDTRHTGALLHGYGIDRSGIALIAVHRHNESEAAQAVIDRLAAGQRVAYASDAGTPAVSDPGARLAAAVRAAGHAVVPLPGASSITAALSAAGIVAPGHDDGSFIFAGFLPSKAGERATALQTLGAQARPVILLEAPHRIAELAAALAPLGERLVTMARELTKQFEEIATLPASGAAAWVAASPQRARGEYVVLLHAAAVTEDRTAAEGRRVLGLLLAEKLPLKSAARLAADITGASRNVLYEAGLALKNEG
ncbi:16S rRNA (cytidine(1402)-2'-O)-methyltransferase [Xylophilus rhododendri]|uniref:Ribosomal RNA small subunit methyltransferase I n=1 Tax=Xylophilus rhododendri TaxID=2697032 RepID=A0A857J493_9BURK|nr:16S rRNA (cytidine(1402)-2'-O)-methyltransferase [Xylophilus rhododendri]QHI97871.1 16S rRNA (cytidine(1402)-2'-O)-methyltransferase [Xylophilus rhododendri]